MPAPNPSPGGFSPPTDPNPQQVPEVRVEHPASEEAWTGIPVTISPRMATVDFPLQGAPGLTIGTEVQLAFVGAHTGMKFEVPAKIRFKGEDAVRRRFEFEIEQDASSVLRSMVERRTAMRVAPDPREPLRIAVKLESVGLVIEGHVENLSTCGLGLLAKGEAPPIPEGSPATICMFLPGEEEPLEITAEVRLLSVRDGMSHLGLEFHGGRASEAEDNRERIVAYLMARQAQILKRLRTP